MIKLKVLFSQGSDGTEVIELSRVPCVDEKLEFGDHAYTVNRVVHHVNSKEIVADVFVSGRRIGGRYVSDTSQLPKIKIPII